MYDVLPFYLTVPCRAIHCCELICTQFGVHSKLSMMKNNKMCLCVYLWRAEQHLYIHLYISLSCPPLPCRLMRVSRVYHFQNSYRLIRFGNYENPESERNVLSRSLSVFRFRLCLCALCCAELCSTANSNGSYSIWCASVHSVCVCVHRKRYDKYKLWAKMNCTHRK